MGINFKKMSSKNTFVLNRLESIKNCNKHPIHFKFVAGDCNPADFITRSISYKKLIKTNYVHGPKFLTGTETNLTLPCDDFIDFIIPNPLINEGKSVHILVTNSLFDSFK